MLRMITMTTLIIILTVHVEALPSVSINFDSDSKLSPVFRLRPNITKAKGRNDHTEIPAKYDVKQNYPNPFNSSTTIEYDMPWEATVSIAIYNVLGQRVRTLTNSARHAGYHSITWDGSDNFGERVASGVYFYIVSAESWYSIRKMIYIR